MVHKEHGVSRVHKQRATKGIDEMLVPWCCDGDVSHGKRKYENEAVDEGVLERLFRGRVGDFTGTRASWERNAALAKSSIRGYGGDSAALPTATG